mgnify:CR=1 FL=1
MNFSQNFIKSPQLVSQLLQYSHLNPGDTVVEIGPGQGIITQKLLDIGCQVIAVEKDRRLISELQTQFSDYKNFKLTNSDFLFWSLPKSPYKIFSNIPFSITALIINKILKSNNKPTEMYLILQQEAAEKFCLFDDINNQDAILVAPFYQVEILGDIDRTAFTPKPQVNIVFTKFSLLKNPLLELQNYQKFRDFIIFGFNQWKPNIFEIYKKIFSYDQFKKINHQLKVSSLKPTQLNFNQWLGLFSIYQEFVPNIKKRLVVGFEKTHLSHVKLP